LKKKESNKWIVKSIMMVTQIGITMIVPIMMCLFIGVKLDEWLGTSFWLFIMLFLGIAAAFRNVFHLTKQFYMKDLRKEYEEQLYFESLKPEKEKNKKRNERNAGR